MFISTVVCLVPVVDCSEAVGVVEMTEVIIFKINLCFVHYCTMYISHTPLAAMPSRPLQPDLYCKIKNCTHTIVLKTWKLPKMTRFVHYILTPHTN